MRQTRTTTSPTNPDAAIRAHLPMIEECASAIAAEARSHHYGAEYDDLRQEGMIAVWLTGAEVDISAEARERLEVYVLKHMSNYVSWLGKQRGAARGK